jgi:hypothetical protein
VGYTLWLTLRLSLALIRIRNVVMVHTRHETVTDRIRARMTDGASREREADGRVVAER